MTAAPLAPTPQPRRLPLRPIALPAEHGGWSLLLEPLVLALLLVPSAGGALLAGAAASLFLTRHPLKLALNDRRRGKRYPRTAWAERFAALYAALALGCGLAALALAGGSWGWPLLLAAPLALLQLRFDAHNRGRDLLPEIAGAAALAAAAPALVLAGGGDARVAWALWAVAGTRAAVSILYVRARLRLERGAPAPGRGPVLAHVLALGGMLALAALDLVPTLSVLAFGALLARAAHGLSSQRRPARATVIGLRELLFGLLTVGSTALGFALGR
ncbi:YwiC-like family protein [Deinococcus multiflagellatus]|uniref:YwiC-like family protein n=1 Tax=Deinococcus multiflagellatus TaxID=1656887 RepID=UPI001CCFB11A|nr:YwiC-like family protein [Deinococcus multiflagellatus]MBZ9713567.1 YwiC-like family protein [Deinococcus multiflagellatus]